jgi:hypothetical protein
MSDWEAVLLAFRAIDARTGSGWFRRKRYSFELADRDVSDAIGSFRAFPPQTGVKAGLRLVQGEE